MPARTMLSYTAFWSSPKPASVFVGWTSLRKLGASLEAGWDRNWLWLCVPPEVAKHGGWLTLRQGNCASPILPSLVPSPTIHRSGSSCTDWSEVLSKQDISYTLLFDQTFSSIITSTDMSDP